MAQEPLDNMSGSNPPSFIPSGAPRRRPSSQDAPQSFQPKSTHRTSGGARQSAPQSSSLPPSFSPVAANHSPSPAPRTAGGRHHAAGGADAAHTGITYRTSSNNSPAKPLHGRNASTATTSLARHPRHPRNRLLTALAVIVVVALLLAFGLISWANGQLNHKTMLTSAANTPASTWLILGSDQRDGTSGTGSSKDIPGSRTDSILVLTKPKTGHSSLISIPRDSFVNINGQDMKINAVASQVGYKALTGQVESITGMKIDHVVQVGFGGVEKVVDAIGGVELCYDSTVNDVLSGLNWKAGCHQANGATALAFSRMRYSDPTGDIGRAKRQRQVLSAVAKKATSPQVLLNPMTTKKLAEAGLSSLTVDEKSGAFDLAQMALAFKSASGDSGVTGSLYYTDIDYRPASGIGSCILLDGARNTELFKQLQSGTHDPGTVGGL